MSVYVLDATGALKQTGGGGGLTSPVGIADGGTGQTSKTPAFDALAPTTTNGDLIYYNGTDNIRLAVGSSGQVLTVSGGAPAWAAAAGGGSGDYIHIEEQQTSGTSGGTFTSGAWQTRVLNTEVSDSGGHASVASNQITLAAGTYRVNISCPVYQVNLHQCRLQNVTDGTTLLLGGSGMRAPTGVGNCATCEGTFTLASSKVLEVQHRCSATGTTTGFGVACSFGTEVYTVAIFVKVA